MNRKLSGEALTVDDLWEIANLNDQDRNAINALHNTALIRSRLEDVTAEERLAMFFRGELKLDTRNEWNSVKEDSNE